MVNFSILFLLLRVKQQKHRTLKEEIALTGKEKMIKEEAVNQTPLGRVDGHIKSGDRSRGGGGGVTGILQHCFAGI